MRSPSVDIIVPVWNSTFETRECLAAIRNHSPEARLIVVDNGSCRETELMLEEFSEPLDDAAIFIKSERNVGLIKAINIGLASSDSDYSVIVRPHVQVTSNWLGELIDTAKFGISIPQFLGNRTSNFSKQLIGVSRMETFSTSFSTMAIKKELRESVGIFDENLDGADWCLFDFVRRSNSHGFRVFVCSGSKVLQGPETVFGSETRLAEIANNSRQICLERWGVQKYYGVYFGKIIDFDSLTARMDTILKAARLGHRFTLFLHGKQYKTFLRTGWNLLHTSIEIKVLPALFPVRNLKKQLQMIGRSCPGITMVEGAYGVLKQITDNAVSFENVEQLLTRNPDN